MSTPAKEEPKPTEPIENAAGEKPLSKSQLKKLAAKKEKEAKKAARAKELAEQRNAAQNAKLSGDNFGVNPILMSTVPAGTTTFTAIEKLEPSLKDKQVVIRGRVHNVRGKGNLSFLIIREGFFSVQCVVVKSDKVPKDMVTFASKISCESIVDITGTVCVPEQSISTTTQSNVEISVEKLFVVSVAATPLPLQIEDVMRPEAILIEQEKAIAAAQAKIDAFVAGKTKEELEKSPLKEQLEQLNADREKEKKYVTVDEPTRLDNRVVEMRSATGHAIFKLSSAVCRLFREALYKRDFDEIQTPKLVGAASEGGAAVFEVKYFDTKAYLAQSPQFYKQMCICGDLPRVFEIGPVFRAENSNSHRHLTEFVGLDLEMAFKENYHEVLDIIMNVLCEIFEGLETRYKKEIDIVHKQFEATKIEYKNWKIFTFAEAVALLREAGATHGDFEDLHTADEILLGKTIKEKYGTDFYAIDKFPTEVRPFYTMPDPVDKRYSNAYDIFLRGQEISSGAQRIHDYEMLKKNATDFGVTVSSIQSYVDSFKYGAMPHAGCGLGLERVVMLFLGLKDVRQTCLFPRDPQRLEP